LLINSNGEVRERNNIQFIKFNVKTKNYFDLIKKAMDKVPAQIEEYYQLYPFDKNV